MLAWHNVSHRELPLQCLVRDHILLQSLQINIFSYMTATMFSIQSNGAIRGATRRPSHAHIQCRSYGKQYERLPYERPSHTAANQ